MTQPMAYHRNILALKEKMLRTDKESEAIAPVLAWLAKLRKSQTEQVKRVPVTRLTDWRIDPKSGIIRHKRGTDHFFSVQGVCVTGADKREVPIWNQPIFVQKEGGILALLCQQQRGTVRFLLQARFEPGNINGIQMGPTIQATQSNLKRHHRGVKPRFSEFLKHPKATIIYAAKHNEEGARFYRKSNTNMLLQLSPSVRITLTKNDNYIWLTLPQIKTLMLYDHIVNPFVKTIVAPL